MTTPIKDLRLDGDLDANGKALKGVNWAATDPAPPGSSGDGNDGWSPILAVVSDSERRVLRVSDWTGGEGTKPATGQYVGPTGLVATAAEAVDIRGATGAAGPNEVTTNTDSNITGLLKGTGSKVAQAVPGTDYTAGNDSRLPTTDQKAALAGTQGTPSASNPFVTTEDKRLGVLFRVQADTTATDLTGGAETVLVYDSKQDPGSLFALATGVFTVPETGWYDLACHYAVAAFATATARSHQWFLRNTDTNAVIWSVRGIYGNYSGANRAADILGWGQVYLEASTNYRLSLRVDPANETHSIGTGVQRTTWFTIRKAIGVFSAIATWAVGTAVDLTGTGSTVVVHEPASSSEYIYNHSNAIAHDGTQFRLVWVNGRHGEAFGGQRLVEATASDPSTWSAPAVLLPALSNVTTEKTDDSSYWAGLQVRNIGGILWCIAEIRHWIDGATDFVTSGSLAVRLTDGATTWLSSSPLYVPETGFPDYAYDHDLAGPISAALQNPAQRLQLAFWPNEAEVGKLSSQPYEVEPTTIALSGGYTVSYARRATGFGENRLSVITHDGTRWWDPALSQVPNDQSKTFALKLTDGRYVLIGNFSDLANVRNPLMMAVSDDGLTWDRWYKIRELTSGGPTYDPTYSTVSPDGRGGGPQYPSAIEHDGSLYIVYSVHKERIELRTISLSAFA